MSLAPKHTRVTQKQRCRLVSPDEIIFETSSHSRDVPYSNQFLVDAVWRLTNLPDGGCELNISVFVRFTKKNWLKSMIERNAVEGSRDWFENWIYSALEVAKHIKHNSSVPHSLRTSATDILAKSIGHSHSRAEEDNTATTVAKTGFMGGKEKLLMIVLLVAALCFLCSSVYFFWSSQTLSDELSQVTSERDRLEENYLYLRTVISLVSSSNERSMEQIHQHWEFWKKDGELGNKLGEWREHLHTLEELIHVLSLEVEGFSIPQAGELSFYEEIALALSRQENSLLPQ